MPNQRKNMKKVNSTKKLTISVITVFSLLLVGTIWAQNNNNGFFSNYVGAFLNPTPTPKIVRSKRKTAKTEQNVSSPGIQEGELNRSLTQVLASTDFNLIGLNGTVSPANQTVPKNIPTAVLTGIQVPEGEDAAPVIAGLNPNYKIRGELTGPSFTSPRIVEAPIGQQISIPAMPNVGDHVLQNLRIIDITDPTNTTIAPVTPDSAGITVIDNILVTQVQVTEMTYDQIIQSGINLNDSNYNFLNFTIGLGTSSGTVPIQIPVALPTVGGLPPVVGNPAGGVNVNGVSVPLPDIVPVMLEGIDEEGNPSPIEMPGGGQMQIPGVVVFPGRIGLLHQFFEAIVIVANGAPNGTPLVITNLKAKAKLPDAGTPNDATDDPLRIAATQQGGVQSQLDIHGLGPDGKYGTADDTTSFNPGQSGQASFLIEGLKEGLHTVDFDLEGTLQGLPGGNVTVRGNVPGAVLVRDAEFGVTFTHPSVVRAGQEYDLGLTIYNSGHRNLNGISVQLRGDSVSGATLIDAEQKSLNQTITPGNSGTVKWRLRSNTTGQVTASYIKVGEGIDAGLNLVTGVGDRNVPLSPDSLILPEAVKNLPPDVVEAGRQMLGQAWSVATAPAGSLPGGVLPVDKQTVVKKAVELGWAGLRIDFHENRDIALRTLLRDWIGENAGNSSSGFADALRNTAAGYYFFDVVGTKFFETVGTESTVDFHKKLVTAESGRSSFISAYVSQNSGQQILGAKINSPTNQSVGFGANTNERFGDLRTGASLNLLETDPHDAANNTKGNLLVVSKPAAGNWSLEINGWANGNADISILAPTTGKNYRQLVFNNVPVTAGKRCRITFKNSGTNAPIIEEFSNGAFRPITLPFTSSDVLDSNPEITGVVQVSDNVIEGGDKYGRLVGVLFSKPMTKSSVETLNRYQIGGGQLVSDPSQTVGRLIKPTGSKINFGDRFTIMSLDSPVGPYIKRTVTANGIVDTTGKFVSNSTKDIEMRVSPQGNPPGGYLTGRVMQADGTAVPNSGVFYRRMKAGNIGGVQGSPCDLLSDWETVSYQKADSNGEYTIDYVREGDCHPVTVLFQNPVTNSEKTLVSNIAYNGQHLIFNAVFLARGNVQGTVTSGGVPLANANVSILSELDPLNNKLVKTDAQGRYSATSVPVGGLTVKAVGTGAFSLSSGIAAGNLSEAGGTVTINVTTQNVSGSIKGKVLDSGNGQAPIQNSLVVAKANIPGFPGFNGPIPVGYAFTQADGSFMIDRLPIGIVYLEAIDPQRGIGTSATVQLTPQNTQQTGVILLISNGFGRVLGRVLNEIGQAIPNAIVQEGSQAVRADSAGNYLLPQTREGNAVVSATDPVTRQTGSTTITVRRNEDTTGADIIIRRPANLNGQVFVNQNGAITPVAQAYVTVDGRKIVRTDSQGRYTLNDVQSGTGITIRFVDPQGRLYVNTDVILNPGETLSRNATFKSGAIHGKITQPDGVTPVVTGVSLTTLRPRLTQDASFGFPEESTLTYQTATDGLYSFEKLNTANYRVSASNVFFPIPVSQSGILQANDNLEINLSLVDTLAGKVSGHIYQPDGITPVGAGVKVSLGGGSLADVIVRTNADGYYEFAEVFAEGGYRLSAIDPLTNRTNQTGVYVRRNEAIEVDLRLLGRGDLKVKVVDGGGLPLQTGSISVTGSTYPNDERYFELTPGNNGEFSFTNLTEGTYAVTALYNSLGGRASGTVTIGGNTEVTIQVQAVGKVTGRVYMPDGTTPVGLADVTLRQGGRIIGLITTQDSEEERGKFEFGYVPAGDFTIDVFDNRSGRQGRSAGTITQQGQTANVSVNLLALGTVTGQVTSNGIPAEHALVNISADGSGISGTSRVATTDADGRFRFPGIPVGRVYISVSNGPGGLTGNAQGIVAGTNEPLPETVINVALTPTASVTGTVYKAGGTERYFGALVRVTSGSFSSNTTTDENGNYRVNFVPLGNVDVKVEAPFGYDRGKSATVASNQAGATITADVTMTGVGNISGTATGSNGSPLTFGKVTFTNNAWGENITVIAPVQSNGTYSMSGLPTGEFNLTLTVPQIVGVGTAADNLAGGQSLVKNLQLESAGKVFGNVKATDGTSPAIGSDIILSLAKQGGGFFTFITHTNSNGDWEIDNLPLGTISVRITDANSGGVASITGLNLNTNGQQLDTGIVTLDNSPISVVSITPVNNSVNVAPNTAVQITFSEPVDAGTVNSGTVKLSLGTSSVSTSQTISGDGTIVTLTPTQALAETQTYTIVVTTQVKDRNGIALAQQFTSTFATGDYVPPSVIQVLPVNNANQVQLNTEIKVTFSEPLNEVQQFSEVIKVFPVGLANNLISGNYTLSNDKKFVVFIPDSLSSNVLYQISVTGQKDAVGNIQSTVFNSTFRTIDNTAPILNFFEIEGQSAFTGLVTSSTRPIFRIGYSDNVAVNENETKLYLAKQGDPLEPVTANTVNQFSLRYQPLNALTAGQYVTKAVITDSAGNQTSSPEFTFTINPQQPQINAVIPNQGYTSGNTVTTIRGLNLISQFIEPDANARGLLGQYSNRDSFDSNSPNLVLERIDEEVNFDLLNETFTPLINRYGNDDVVWKGKIIPRFTEEYTFKAEYSGEFSVSIDNQNVINGVKSTTIRQETGSISLVAGQSYDIIIRNSPYYVYSGYPNGEYGIHHVAKLFWSSQTQTQEIVPKEQLRPAAKAVSPTILFGGQPVTVLGAVSRDEDEIAVLTPPRGEGLVTIEVQNDIGVVTVGNGFTYLFDNEPAYATTISPMETGRIISPPSKVSAAFNEPLAAIQNFNDVFKVLNITAGYTEVPGNITLDETGRKLTFIPTAPFSENTEYQITIVNQSDLVGNVNTNVRNSVFKTTDLTGPNIYYLTPDAVTVYNQTQTIRAFYEDLFSSIDKDSAVLTVDGVNVTAQAILYNQGLEYTPSQPFALGEHSYNVKVADINGNYSERNGTFTVSPDTAPPQITSFRIAGNNGIDGLQIRDRQPYIEIEFEDLGRLQNAQQKLYFGLQGSVLPLVSSNAVGGNGFWRMNYQPNQQLDFGLYAIRAELIDEAGNITSRTVNFEIIDLESIPPQVTGIMPTDNTQQVASNAVITVQFSEPLNPNQNFNDSMFVYNQDGLRKTGTYSLSGDGLTLIFTPAEPLSENTRYFVYLFNYLDLAGNQGNGFGSAFSTVDTIAPQIDSFYYRNGENIELNGAGIYTQTPEFYFNISDSLSGVDQNTLVFKFDGITIPISGYVLQFTYQPTNPLAFGSHTVSVQIADNAGNVSQEIISTFEISRDPRIPFSVENDTVLLWHLDEQYNGVEGASYAVDAGPLMINSSEDYSSSGGRFVRGVENPSYIAENDENFLAFGGNGFTVEGWLKYRFDVDNLPNEPYTIWSRGIGTQNDFALNLLPNGDLQAQVFNAGGDVWETVLPKSTFDVADNQWHSIAMAVERGAAASQNQLKIYVDGIIRASVEIPAGFGAMRNTNGRFRLGSGYQSSPVGLDEIRISNTPHNAARIMQNYNRQDLGLVILRSIPAVIQKDTVTDITLQGYNLEDITAQLTDLNGLPVAADVAVINTSSNSAELQITANNGLSLGNIRLTISSGSLSAQTILRVVNQQPFTPDNNTLLLWHFDELTGFNVVDSSTNAINGTSFSSNVSGRFGKARNNETSANTNPAALSLSNDSFTIETWIKQDYITRNNVSVFKKGETANNADSYSLTLLTDGRIQARLQDNSQVIWEAFTNPLAGNVFDNNWHYISVVVNRTENNLAIYVDGILRADVAAPPQFTQIRNTTQRFTAGDSGIITDELRVLNYPRTALEISDTWLGTINGIGYLPRRFINPTVGKRIPPKSSPDKQPEKSAMNTVIPADIQVKRDFQKGELR